MSDDVKEIIVNGKRYVPEETSKYVEATVAGRMTVELKELGARHDALVLADWKASMEYMFHDQLPVGTRIRMYAVDTPKVESDTNIGCDTCKFFVDVPGSQHPCITCHPGFPNWEPK